MKLNGDAHDRSIPSGAPPRTLDKFSTAPKLSRNLFSGSTRGSEFVSPEPLPEEKSEQDRQEEREREG